MTRIRPFLAPLGVAAVVLAATPAAASLLGVDSLRGWLGLTRAAGAVVRCTLLSYSILVAARAVNRGPAGSGSAVVARSVAAILVLAAIALVGAFLWSSPPRTVDASEWVLLFVCPSAAVTGLIASTLVLLWSRGADSLPKGGVVRAASALVVIGVLVYLLMRVAGVPTLPRVFLPVSLAAVVAVLLAARAFNSTQGAFARVAPAVLAGAIIIVLAAA